MLGQWLADPAGAMARWRFEFEKKLDPSLWDAVGIPIVYEVSAQMSSAAGRYFPAQRGDQHTIKLSPFMGDDEARETFGHEYAHFVDHAVPGYARGDSHGLRWKYIMTCLGLPPVRCHAMNLRGRRQSIANIGKLLDGGGR